MTPRPRPRAAVLVAILIAVPPLSSCGLFVKMLGVPTDCERYVEELDFATSDRILRGAWHGTVADLPAGADARALELDLTATFDTRSRYEVRGTFELEGEGPATLVGAVSGGCEQRYDGSASTSTDTSVAPTLSTESLPPSASFGAEIRDATGATRWRVSGGLSAIDSGRLDLTIESVADRDVRGHTTLERGRAP